LAHASTIRNIAGLGRAGDASPPMNPECPGRWSVQIAPPPGPRLGACTIVFAGAAAPPGGAAARLRTAAPRKKKSVEAAHEPGPGIEQATDGPRHPAIRRGPRRPVQRGGQPPSSLKLRQRMSGGAGSPSARTARRVFWSIARPPGTANVAQGSRVRPWPKLPAGACVMPPPPTPINRVARSSMGTADHRLKALPPPFSAHTACGGPSMAWSADETGPLRWARPPIGQAPSFDPNSTGAPIHRCA